MDSDDDDSEDSCNITCPTPDCNDDETLNIMIDILEKPSIKRSDLELKLLIPFFKKVKFFNSNQDEQISNEDLKFISERVFFQFVNGGQTVFKYGDMGDTFYIILKGEVSVIVPKKKQKIISQETLKKREENL